MSGTDAASAATTTTSGFPQQLAAITYQVSISLHTRCAVSGTDLAYRHSRHAPLLCDVRLYYLGQSPTPNSAICLQQPYAIPGTDATIGVRPVNGTDLAYDTTIPACTTVSCYVSPTKAVILTWGMLVQVSVLSGSGTLSGTTSVTAVNGIAEVSAYACPMRCPVLAWHMLLRDSQY
eukprot:3941399-Rhodomonas_salina.7